MGPGDGASGLGRDAVSPGAALRLSLVAAAASGMPADTSGAVDDSVRPFAPPAPRSSRAVVRPIRTNTPGTGVFIGSGLLVRTLLDRESNGATSLESWTAVADGRHTPATHWVIGARVPVLLDRSLEEPDAGTVSRSGLGDASISVKHRFFRRVGRWSDRHAAVELEAKLPTGASEVGGSPVVSDLPVERRHRLQPGSGSLDVAADLIYQEGRGRFVYGGDLSFRLNTEGEAGYRFGNELRLNLDLEYVLFPLEYRRPGHEVFVLLEATLRRKWADEVDGRHLERTERTDLLLAPAVQHIVSDRLLASLSVQLPAASDAPAGGLEQDLNVLAEIRYAF